MQHDWIWLTLLASLLQAVRTAAQKNLGERMSPWSATYVRALIGLPLMAAYLAIVASLAPGRAPLGLPEWNGGAFFGWCAVAALTQNLGSYALLSLYQFRNFAVANQLARTNLFFTAVLGSLFFSEAVSAAGWLAILLAFLGAVMLTLRRVALPYGGVAHWTEHVDAHSVRVGLFIGMVYGICNLAIREAALSLDSGEALLRGAATVVTVTGMQAIGLGAWLAWREPGFLSTIWQERRTSLFVGVTSAIGSISWFGAFAITNASYVMAVGQVEAVFSILISVAYFRERIAGLELAGIAVVVAGILVFALAG